nr:nuclear transport factor 2 family protein [Paenibacillus sp. 1001270B_150601_E10]
MEVTHRHEVEAALKCYIKATNTHDFSEVEKLLHKDAVYWFSDRTCKSLEEIRAYFEHAWDVVREEVYSAHDVQWMALDERAATCIYTYRYEGIVNGAKVSGTGRATNVFVRQEEDWRLIHEHLSAL